MNPIKNILVPTDFSSFAKSAVKIAIHLCRLTNARLHLFHCTSLPMHWDHWSPSEQMAYQKLQSEDMILEKMDRVHEVTKYENVSVINHVRNGKLLPLLSKSVDQLHINLIVMGSHGASGKEEYFIGSNAQKVVRKVHCSVLIIKQEPDLIAFKNVAFVTHPKDLDLDSFEHFLQFVKHFQPTDLHIVSVALPGHLRHSENQQLKDLELLAKQIPGLHWHYHLVPQFTVDAGVRQFSHENDIELVGISNHHRHPIKKIFTSSNVEFLVNHIDTPLLTIDF